MDKLLVLYFSGTGNTKFAAKELCRHLNVYECNCVDISVAANANDLINAADIVFFAYPIYGSCVPIIMSEFVEKYKTLFKGKTVGIMSTQYLFSGDGAALLGRTLKKYGAIVKWGFHVNLPSNISDADVFKIKNGEENNRIVEKAHQKIKKVAIQINTGKNKKQGFSIFSRGLGLIQRLPFKKVLVKMRGKVKIDEKKCNKCSLCVKHCPVSNLKMEEGVKQQDKCVLCYRCVNNCPKAAITILGKNPPKTQYKGIK